MDLADQMGFLVMDEVFDCWQRSKTTNDFHLIFDEWHEQDLRSLIRRDKNHPSVIMWSVGNEVGEQSTGDAGAAIAKMLHDIAHNEDPGRLVTASMNSAHANQSFPAQLDIISLNYQGEGIRDAPAYHNLSGLTTPPQYPIFHSTFPGKVILSSETASTLSTRGTYMFPVAADSGAPVNDASGGNSTSHQVSAYELYTADFGSSPDKVFSTQDQNLYVAGEFVWTGWDYLGEPTPYYDARSSYFGIIDLAGFKKDRFFLYQSRWNPEIAQAHILPHWTWPNRVNQTTPVHVFSSGDEAELFLNNESQGRKTKEQYTYRFRWDDIAYQPGELHVVTYRDGKEWANDTVKTAGEATGLRLSADRSEISGDGLDLSYVSVEVVDKDGTVVPEATNTVSFALCGPGEIVATDNGDPIDFVAFPSLSRDAYSGLALAIVKSRPGASGKVIVQARAEGLKGAQVTLQLK